MRPLCFPLALGVLVACGGSESDTDETPLELTPDLCDDPSKLADIVESLGGGGGLAGNAEQVQRMLEAPTEGPFYMVNLIRYREWAEYPDGRQTDLTGREANDLYAPLEFLQAIGARVVYNSEVEQQIEGDDILWEDVAIVEYPCPLAFFAMAADEEFRERAIHKEAGVETTIVMVTDLVPQPAPDDPDQSESPYAPTPEDPAFDLVGALDFHEVAQYQPEADEPERTGREAWALYASAEQEVSAHIGAYVTARFVVQGVFIGDEPNFDEIQLVRMPSRAGLQVLLDDETRQAGLVHRHAALAQHAALITVPLLSRIPQEGED